MLAPNFNAPCAAKKPNRKLVADATNAIKIASTKIARINAPRVSPAARIVPNCQRRDRTEFATAPTTAIDAIISVVIGVLLNPQITESARLEIERVNESRVDIRKRKARREAELNRSRRAFLSGASSVAPVNRERVDR